MRTASRSWPGARIIGTLLIILAWIVLVLGVAAIIFALVRGGMTPSNHAVLRGMPNGTVYGPGIHHGIGIVAAIARFLVVAAAFLLLYAAGETLRMLAAIAENSAGNANIGSLPPSAPYPPSPSAPSAPQTPTVQQGPSASPPAGADDPTYPPR